MSYMVRNLVALIFFIVVVHLSYIGYIRPEAQLVIEAAREAGQTAPRSLVVILELKSRE